MDEFGDPYDAARAVVAIKKKQALAEGEESHLIYPVKKFWNLKELTGVADPLSEQTNTAFKVKFLFEYSRLP